MIRRALIFLLVVITAPQLRAGDAAADAINGFGLDLLRVAAPGGNTVFSPFSISTALTMTMGGAAGPTKTEMAKVLHFTDRTDKASDDFAALRAALTKTTTASAKYAAEQRGLGRRVAPVQLQMATRLFAHNGFKLRPEFSEAVQRQWDASPALLDFRQVESARGSINGWAEERTSGRITNLIPPGAIKRDTRFVIANALYFKAPWGSEFDPADTRMLPFYDRGTKAVNTSTMHQQSHLGYARQNGYTAVRINYIGSELHLLILLPDARDGITALMQALTAAQLTKLAKLERTEVKLWLPKFKLAPPTVDVAARLQQLGMKSAFDVPGGSADLSGIAGRTATDYLALTGVFHRAFIDVTEQGTEAAAATEESAEPFGGPEDKGRIPEVRVNHPFLFAIQHAESGACLFMGRLTHLE